MARRRRVLLWAFAPLALVLACVGPRSIQGPIHGGVELSDGGVHDDVVARLRCQGHGFHGAHRTDQEFRVFGPDGGFLFVWAWRGVSPAGCSVELLHPLYQMVHMSLERHFTHDLGRVRMVSWAELLDAPDGLTHADVHRQLFYLRHYWLAAFRSERARDRLAGYVPELHALLDRGLHELPPMDLDRFGSVKGSLENLRAIEAAVGYARAPEQEALFAAAEAGDADEVAARLAAGADPDAWNAQHSAAIHLAAAGRHTDTVAALLEGGADPDRREEGLGTTALLTALRGRDAETARLLLEHGADVTLASQGRVPLALAAGQGFAPMVEDLIARGAIVRAREARHPVDALHAAARAGRSDVVRILLAAGVPVDGGLPGFTALMHAAWKGRLETVEILLAKGADPSAVSITGKTPLGFAREENRTEVVALLESRGTAE